MLPLFAFFVLACWRRGAEAAPAFAYGGLPRSKWVLTFEDNFAGDSINASLWEVRNNETHCEPCEPQLYVSSAVSVSNGSLLLETSRADNILGPGGAHFNFTSGWVDTKLSFAQQFGLFETSVRLPPQAATGVWPAFWTLPLSSQCWPTGGEIDVFEYTANPLANDIFGSYRWGTQCDVDEQVLPGASYPPFGAPPIDWSSGFHVIAALWNASDLSFFVDGVLYETKNASQVILPTAPQYMILDAAVAWFFPPGPEAAYPCTTAFDYVRVYSLE